MQDRPSAGLSYVGIGSIVDSRIVPVVTLRCAGGEYRARWERVR